MYLTKPVSQFLKRDVNCAGSNPVCKLSRRADVDKIGAVFPEGDTVIVSGVLVLSNELKCEGLD